MACSSESSVSALPELELSELEKEQIVIVIPSSLPPGSTPPPPTPTLVMSSLLYPPLPQGPTGGGLRKQSLGGSVQQWGSVCMWGVVGEAEMSVPVLCPHGAHSALTGFAFSSPRTAKNRACPPSHPMWEGVPQGPGGSGSTIANCVPHRWWCLGTILQPIPSPSHIRKLSSRGQVEVAEGQSVAGAQRCARGQLPTNPLTTPSKREGAGVSAEIVSWEGGPHMQCSSRPPAPLHPTTSLPPPVSWSSRAGHSNRQPCTPPRPMLSSPSSSSISARCLRKRNEGDIGSAVQTSSRVWEEA